MKKILAVILMITTQLYLCSVFVLASDTSNDSGIDTKFQPITFNFMEKVEVETESGLDLGGPHSGHGNHQTRVVHTSHGDYICSTTNGQREGKYLKNEFRDGVLEVSVMKVEPNSSECRLVLQRTINYHTSQISVIADKDENIWAGIVIEDSFRNFRDAHKNGIMIELYRIDAETDDVEFYTTIISGKDINGDCVGYSSFYYDESIDCIVTFSTDSVACDDSYLYWHVFDCEARKFDAETRVLAVHGGRESYPFFEPDGKGGLVLITNRNPEITSKVTYTPEMGTNDGIPMDVMRKYFPQGRELQYYCFDQINAHYIPNIRSEENVRSFTVYDTDRSRIKGTLEERLTPEFRMTNEYPIIANNNGGDTYLTEDGLLHVTLKVSYALEAWDHSTTESRWVHVVYDVETGEKLSESEIWDEIADGREYEARLYRDPFTKDFYIVSTILNQFVIRKAVGSASEGYTYEEVITSDPLPSLTRHNETRWIDCINLAHHRSNSTPDGVLSVVGRAPYGYDLFRINLTYNVGTEDNPIAITDLTAVKSIEALPGTTYYTVDGVEEAYLLNIEGNENISVTVNGQAAEAEGGTYSLELSENSKNTVVITNTGTEQLTCAVTSKPAPADETDDPQDTSPPSDDTDDPNTAKIIAVSVGAAIFVILVIIFAINKFTKKK